MCHIKRSPGSPVDGTTLSTVLRSDLTRLIVVGQPTDTSRRSTATSSRKNTEESGIRKGRRSGPRPARRGKWMTRAAALLASELARLACQAQGRGGLTDSSRRAGFTSGRPYSIHPEMRPKGKGVTGHNRRRPPRLPPPEEERGTWPAPGCTPTMRPHITVEAIREPPATPGDRQSPLPFRRGEGQGENSPKPGFAH